MEIKLIITGDFRVEARAMETPTSGYTYTADSAEDAVKGLLKVIKLRKDE